MKMMMMMSFKTSLIIIFLGLQSSTTTLAQSPVSAPVTPPVSPPAPPLSSPLVSPPLSSPPPVSPPAPPLSPPPPPPPAPPLASPPAAVSALPPSSGPDNITAILEKAGHFGTLIRFLKRTLVADRITTLLNTTNTGITLFAPTDAAFSNLKPGTLNSLNDQQQVTLLLYHIIPSYLSLAQFQTVSNPVQTQAGSDKTRFPLYITATGSSVNMTTGMVNTTIAGIVYNDGQVAIYQLNKVLLSVGVLRPAVTTRAPAPSPKMAKTSSEAPSVSQDASVADTSDVDGKKMRVGVALALQALAVTLLLPFSP